jgi:triacylglycerol lipase
MDKLLPRLRAPIVLHHGFLGFDELKVCGWVVARYFAGIPDLLSATGNRVFVARVSPAAPVADRAQQLKDFLDRQLPGEGVHLVAHSMGGLDSRYLISRLGMASRVLTLTTLGTPHRGTVFADWAIRRLQHFVRPLLRALRIPADGVYDLTPERCREFNAKVPDAPGVRYFSVAGRHQGTWRSPEWQLPHRVISRLEGPNDGLVSVTSARYGESTDLWEGDHISMIHWLNPLQQRGQSFRHLIRRLADCGY